MMKVFKTLFKIGLIISLFLFLVWFSMWYMAKPINDFCSSLTKKSTYENVVSRARELNYRIYDDVKEKNGTLSIEAQETPLFRMACFITFKDNVVLKKQVSNSD